MQRITEKMLQQQVDHLNNLAGVPAEPYTDCQPNPNVFHLSHAYGGVALHRMCNTGTGVNDIFGYHMPKRELYGRIESFVAGYQSGC